MCEAHAFLIEDGKEKKILTDVDIVEFDKNMVILKNIFGEQKILNNVKFKSYNNQQRKLIFEK